MFIRIIFYILPFLEYCWYITTTTDLSLIDGDIKSVESGPIIYPELEWEYRTFTITECTTLG